MENKVKSKKKEARSLKKYMHPRNPYRTPPSFKKLAISYPKFREFCSYDIQGRVHLDFKDPSALRALTASLLDQDFGLKVEIPEDRLVPTLPLRFNYLLWIEDLLCLVHPNSSPELRNANTIGFDIGTGAACIYPLLGCKHFGWRLLASESDELSFRYAQENILKNGLKDQILIKKQSSFFDILDKKEAKDFISKLENTKRDEDQDGPSSSLSRNLQENGDLCGGEREAPSFLIDFTMCNPPFFSSEEEMDTGSKTRRERSKPISTPTGAMHEKVVEGGEVAFIAKMIEESTSYKHRIRLFTSLIGQKKDLQIIKKLLAQANPAHVKFTEFCQGRTMRWGVAWTFEPSFCIDKNISKKEKLCNKPLTLILPRASFSVCSALGAWKKVSLWLKDLKIKPNVFKSSKYFVGAHIRAYKKTWLHQRRKRREEARKMAEAGEVDMSANRTESLEGQTKRKMKGATEETTLPPLKTPKLVESDSIPSCDQEDPPMGEHCDVEAGGAAAVSKGLECLLRCSIHVKQTQGMISLEMVPLGGANSKESVNELMQYFKNRLKNDP